MSSALRAFIVTTFSVAGFLACSSFKPEGEPSRPTPIPSDAATEVDGGAGPIDAGASLTDGALDSATDSAACRGSDPGGNGRPACGGDCPQKCNVGGTCGRASDCAPELGCKTEACKAYASCKDLHAARPDLPSGTYTIQADTPFQAYCDMEQSGGGWTLALKADGKQKTFHYSAPIWTSSIELRPDSTNMDAIEAKLRAFSNTAGNELLLRFDTMGTPTVLRWSIPPQQDIADPSAPARPVTLDVAMIDAQESPWLVRNGVDRIGDWTALVPGSNPQTGCVTVGFNPGASVRIGLLASADLNCGKTSWIGVGGKHPSCAQGLPDSSLPSVGSARLCTVDDVTVASFAYVFIR
jgi:hypothetical protein